MEIITDHRNEQLSGRKYERQATLAIACLYLNLTHLLRGGQVRRGVYACF
jgi:hypothetical protein